VTPRANLCGIGLRDDLRRLTDVDVGQRTLDDLGADDVGGRRLQIEFTVE
jgi:hypothetical protein